MENQNLPQWATVNYNCTYTRDSNGFKLSHRKKGTYIYPRPPFKFKLYDSSAAQANQALQKSIKVELIDPNTKTYFETPQLTKRLANKYNKITSDQYRRGRYLGAELERKILKGLLSSNSEQIINKHQKHLGKKDQIDHSKSLQFSQLAYNSAVNRKLAIKMNTLTRIRNRCVLTSHPSTIGKLGISRIVFRTLAGFGQLPGIAKI